MNRMDENTILKELIKEKYETKNGANRAFKELINFKAKKSSLIHKQPTFSK